MSAAAVITGAEDEVISTLTISIVRTNKVSDLIQNNVSNPLILNIVN